LGAAARKLQRVKALEAAEPGQWQKYAWLLERSDINFSLSERLKFMMAERGDEPPAPQPDLEAQKRLDATMRKKFGLPDK
jgi:hypothetical protein